MLLDDTLTRWLTRPRNLTDQRPLIPREEQIAVALALGLDEKALDRADMASQLQVARCQALFRADPVDVHEAVEAAQTARWLAPWRLDALDAISEARVLLFEQTARPRDRQVAEAVTRQLIHADPAQAAAFVRLNRIARVELAEPAETRPLGVRGTNWQQADFDVRWLWGAVIGAMSVAIILGVLLAKTAGAL